MAFVRMSLSWCVQTASMPYEPGAVQARCSVDSIWWLAWAPASSLLLPGLSDGEPGVGLAPPHGWYASAAPLQPWSSRVRAWLAPPATRARAAWPCWCLPPGGPLPPENHPCNSAARYVATHFSQTVAQGSAQQHAHRPVILSRFCMANFTL